MKKDIERLHILVKSSYKKVANMEQDIMFLRSKKVERKNTIWSLKKIWLNRRQIGEEIRGIKSWLRELIHAQAKQELIDEQQARIRDLEFDSSLIERESLLSQSHPSSHQPTTGLHDIGTECIR